MGVFMNYDILNKAIYEFFYVGDRINTRIKYFDLVTRLSYIIIENTSDLTKQEYTKKVNINNSIDLVADFFYKINPDYANRFLNILREKNTYGKKEKYSVNFNLVKDIHGKSYSNDSSVDINGLVNIDINETLEDVFTIVHEMTHKLKISHNQFSSINSYFEETASITMEFLLKDYLLEKNEFSKSEIIKYENNRFIDTLESAGVIVFETILLNLYCQNSNHIDEKILTDYLKTIPLDTKIGSLIHKNWKSYLKGIIHDGELQFYVARLYVIGTLLACDLYSKIKDDKSNIKILFSLIDKLGVDDFEFENDLELLQKLEK